MKTLTVIGFCNKCSISSTWRPLSRSSRPGASLERPCGLGSASRQSANTFKGLRAPWPQAHLEDDACGASYADGEALISHAREMLEIDGKVSVLFNQTRLRGRLRLGISEDFVTSRLTAVLESFIRQHPLVDLELTVDLSGVLYEAQAKGDLDLSARQASEGRGEGALPAARAADLARTRQASAA